MRKKLTAIVLAVLAFSMIAASAASLGGINTQSDLGAEVALISGCDDTGIAVDFEYTYAAGEYQTTLAKISGLDADCEGDDISVTLSGASGSLGEDGGTVSGGAFDAAISASAAEVTGIAVVVEG